MSEKEKEIIEEAEGPAPDFSNWPEFPEVPEVSPWKEAYQRTFQCVQWAQRTFLTNAWSETQTAIIHGRQQMIELQELLSDVHVTAENKDECTLYYGLCWDLSNCTKGKGLYEQNMGLTID